MHQKWAEVDEMQNSEGVVQETMQKEKKKHEEKKSFNLSMYMNK